MKDRPTYQISVRPEPDCTEAEVTRGLKWLLKRAFRQYGLKCVEITVVKPEASEAK